MPAPATTQEFLDLVQKSGVVDQKRLGAFLASLQATDSLSPEPAKVADAFRKHVDPQRLVVIRAGDFQK